MDLTNDTFDFDANSTQDVYEKTAATNSSTPMPHAIPVGANHVAPMTIAMCVVFFSAMIINVFGNSFLLTAIRTTPSLWSKTNRILANLVVADLISGFAIVFYMAYSLKAFVFAIVFYMAYSLKAYVFDIPCKYNLIEAVIMPLFKLPPYASELSLVIVAIDRYVAIAHPLIYEEKITDRVVIWMISSVWISGALFASTYWIWLINRDRVPCTTIPNMTPDKYNYMELMLNLLVMIFIGAVYIRILIIARRHHIQIRHESQLHPVSITPDSLKVHGSNGDQEKHKPQHKEDLEQHKQQRQLQIQQEQAQTMQYQKNRRREFKAVYLTAVIVGTFIFLWMPRRIGRMMQLSGNTEPYVSFLLNVGGALGMMNMSCNWMLYGVINTTYRKAFKRLITSTGRLGKE